MWSYVNEFDEKPYGKNTLLLTEVPEGEREFLTSLGITQAHAKAPYFLFSENLCQPMYKIHKRFGNMKILYILCTLPKQSREILRIAEARMISEEMCEDPNDMSSCAFLNRISLGEWTELKDFKISTETNGILRIETDEHSFFDGIMIGKIIGSGFVQLTERYVHFGISCESPEKLQEKLQYIQKLLDSWLYYGGICKIKLFNRIE